MIQGRRSLCFLCFWLACITFPYVAYVYTVDMLSWYLWWSHAAWYEMMWMCGRSRLSCTDRKLYDCGLRAEKLYSVNCGHVSSEGLTALLAWCVFILLLTFSLPLISCLLHNKLAQWGFNISSRLRHPLIPFGHDFYWVISDLTLLDWKEWILNYASTGVDVKLRRTFAVWKLTLCTTCCLVFSLIRESQLMKCTQSPDLFVQSKY